MKIAYFICAALLALGALELPIGYYTFLRIVVTIGAVIAVMESHAKSGIGFWTILFALVGILFNPIFPVYLYDKEAWIVIDLLVAILFAIFGFQSKNEK